MCEQRGRRQLGSSVLVLQVQQSGSDLTYSASPGLRTARHFTLRSGLLLPGEIQAVGKERAQGHYTSGLMSPSIPMFFLCLHLSICEMGVIPGS